MPEPQQQVLEAYAGIGRAIVGFSYLTGALERGCLDLLHPRQDLRLGRILTTGMTAGPLAEAFFTLVAVHVPEPNEDEKQIISTLRNQIEDLTAKRNSIAHASWLVGYWAGPEQEDLRATMQALYLKRTKQGLSDERTPPTNVDELNAYADKCYQTAMEVHFLVQTIELNELSGPPAQGGRHPIDDRYACDDNGRWRPRALTFDPMP